MTDSDARQCPRGALRGSKDTRGEEFGADYGQSAHQQGPFPTKTECSEHTRPSTAHNGYLRTSPSGGETSLSPTHASSSDLTQARLNAALHQQATSQQDLQPTDVGSRHEARTESLRRTLSQLGINLPAHTVTRMATTYDGLTPLTRFVTEDGPWAPISRGNVAAGRTASAGRGGASRGGEVLPRTASAGRGGASRGGEVLPQGRH